MSLQSFTMISKVLSLLLEDLTIKILHREPVLMAFVPGCATSLVPFGKSLSLSLPHKNVGILDLYSTLRVLG